MDRTHELKENKKRSISAMKQSIAAIKFVFSEVLEQKVQDVLNIRFRKDEKIPVVLSENEVTGFLNSVENIKHKFILMTIYSPEIRLNELLF